MPSLIDRYSEPHRHYHTLEHIKEMNALLQETIEAAHAAEGETLNELEYEALRLSIWYHDAVYDPMRDDNEERSIDLARQELGGRGLHPDIMESVVRLIHSTAEHKPKEQDEKILSDLDLAILGSDRYTQYVDQIREEYGLVSDDRWRIGRSALLQSFLDRPQIFYYLTHLESRARSNISWELGRLAQGG